MDSSYKYSGEYLAVMRRWIQRNFWDGDRVTWGSTTTVMTPKHPFSPYELDVLAGDIRDAVLRQFKIKDLDHGYRYTILTNGEGSFIQYADTQKEVWGALFPKAEWFGIKDNKTETYLVHGTTDLVRSWVEDEKNWVDGVLLPKEYDTK